MVVMSADQMPEARQRGDDRNELEPAERVRDALEVAVKEVAHLGADVVRVRSVRRDDLVDDPYERVRALRVEILEAAAASPLEIEKAALKVPPDEGEVEELPENEIGGEKRNEDERDACRTDHRINV